MMNQEKDEGNDSDGSDDSDIAFTKIDLSGVNFDVAPSELSAVEKTALALEEEIAFGRFSCLNQANEEEEEELAGILELGHYLASGRYAEALKGDIAHKFLKETHIEMEGEEVNTTVASQIRRKIFSETKSIIDCIEMEFIGIAALNLFLQLNYTGPSLEESIVKQPGVSREVDPLKKINPHACFAVHLDPNRDLSKEREEEKKESITMASYRHTNFHNAVLSELAVDGEWPCQVCETPYFLLLARSILLPLSDPVRPDWMKSSKNVDQDLSPLPVLFESWATKLTGSKLWSARAAVSHARLLQCKELPQRLWEEVQNTFQSCLENFCNDRVLQNTDESCEEEFWACRRKAATVMLEWGLAQYHFDRPKMGKKAFQRAKEYSGLLVSLTGASGVRTKFQTKNTAQMLVEAASAARPNQKETKSDKELIEGQKIDHAEDEILLERIKFEDETKNEIKELTVLDQAILLALCLDVKNDNPTGDELTAEEMGAYLARVLDHHDDWMLYSTALLERAWLEFEKTHGRERALLQIQALADQHTNRLTLTQSTKQSIAESAAPEERLRNLHTIVYPPRWSMIKDLADRYANLSIFMSAAELFAQIELWDEVVECYRRSGREAKAEDIVRERLAVEETPRMWAALGDLTKDPQNYEKAVELSRGRYSQAFVALGAHYFDKGELQKAAEYYDKALTVRPVAPAVWFRMGTISMQLARWDDALRSFSRVVQLEPEEHEAWANVAAIHIRNKRPSEAYPALSEALKHNRNSWRVWTSKLYVCLDLKKYDEAIQAANSILDLKNQKQASDGIPPLEKICVRAIVGGALKAFHESRDNPGALDAARRTLSRTNALLDRVQSGSNPEPWLFETIAFFHEGIGGEGSKEVHDNLMKEYRSLQTVAGWEKDDMQVSKVCHVVAQCADIQRREGSREALTKSKFLVRGVIQKVQKSRMDATRVPECIFKMEKLLQELEGDIIKLQQ